MTSSFQLGLPVDIPWRRICVTPDMIDRIVCDNILPPKWQSSIAVFRYDPEEDYQNYRDYKISYLKVVVTVSGYQPWANEIQGTIPAADGSIIDWSLNTKDVPFDELDKLLSSYFPCHGAILQVIVGPRNADPDRGIKNYPFFMDFEPKKRELYELASDTRERQSRSLESVSLSKSGGATKSVEVLDIDMGGSSSVGIAGEASGVAGSAAGSLNIGSASYGQWGTRSLNTRDSMTNRSTDQGQEKRESDSFTTQISQLYGLLDTYHLGTNRGVFFLQPRPHVLEQPTGFVRGPRPIEGIQEFFLVVANPKDEDDYCVSVRLDTGHLTEVDVYDYEEKSENTELLEVSAPVAKRDDPRAGEDIEVYDGGWYWKITRNGRDFKRSRLYEDDIFICTRRVTDEMGQPYQKTEIYTAPPGFIIQSVEEITNETGPSLGNQATWRTNSDNRSITMTVQAEGYACFGDINDPDDEDIIERTTGYARLQLRVRLISESKTVPLVKQKFFMMTTRGLCCCEAPDKPAQPEEGLVGEVVKIPSSLGGLVRDREISDALYTLKASDEGRTSEVAVENKGELAENSFESRSSAAVLEANELSMFIKRRMAQSLGRAPAKSFIQTDLFIDQMKGRLLRSRQGRKQLKQRAEKILDKKVVEAVARIHGKEPEALTVHDVLERSNEDLARRTGLSVGEVFLARMNALGVRLHRKDAPTTKQKNSKNSE